MKPYSYYPSMDEDTVKTNMTAQGVIEKGGGTVVVDFWGKRKLRNKQNH